MPQFKFLVMTESIFVYKLYLSSNISDFNFYVKTANPPPPPKKKTTVLSKIRGPVRPPLFQSFVGGSTPPPPAETGIAIKTSKCKD